MKLRKDEEDLHGCMDHGGSKTKTRTKFDCINAHGVQCARRQLAGPRQILPPETGNWRA